MAPSRKHIPTQKVNPRAASSSAPSASLWRISHATLGVVVIIIVVVVVVRNPISWGERGAEMEKMRKNTKKIGDAFSGKFWRSVITQNTLFKNFEFLWFKKCVFYFFIFSLLPARANELSAGLPTFIERQMASALGPILLRKLTA